MHFSQNKLWQHLVYIAPIKISRQIGHVHLSSVRETDAMFDSLLRVELYVLLEFVHETIDYDKFEFNEEDGR